MSRDIVRILMYSVKMRLCVVIGIAPSQWEYYSSRGEVRCLPKYALPNAVLHAWAGGLRDKRT